MAAVDWTRRLSLEATMPFDIGSTAFKPSAEGRARNRRVELIVR